LKRSSPRSVDHTDARNDILGCVGPTTPKRATTSLAASVDPTDARKT
jgi:hypothetical protein